MWKKTLSMIKDHPLTGVGSGNWKVVIPSYGLANTVFAKGYFAPDRVHNTYLQIASETGAPGFLFYFGMWVIIAVTGFIVIRKTNSNDKKILVILMLAGLSAVAVDSFFSFAVERIEQPTHVSHSGVDILLRIVDLCNTKPPCGRGHQLHQPAGAFWRTRGEFEGRFLMHLGVDQKRVDAVSAGRIDNVRIVQHVSGRKAF